MNEKFLFSVWPHIAKSPFHKANVLLVLILMVNGQGDTRVEKTLFL